MVENFRGLSIFLTLVLAIGAGLSAGDGSSEVFSSVAPYEGTTHIYSTSAWVDSGTVYDGSRRVSNVSNLYKRDLKTTLGYNYGVKKSLQMGLFFPLISRSYRTNQFQGTVRGMGDATIYAKHMVINTLWPGGGWEGSAILAFDLPTGKHGYKDNGQRLPDSFQLGRGSISTTVGLSNDWEYGKIGFKNLTTYESIATGAHGLDRGDVFKTEWSFKYRVLMQNFPKPNANLRVGVAYKHIDNSERHGIKQRNSGGDTYTGKIALITHATPEYDTNLVYSFPLKINVNGTQLTQDHKVQFVFGYRF